MEKNCQFSGIAKQLNLLLLLTLVWWIGWWKPGEARDVSNLTIYSLNKQEARWRVEEPDAATAATAAWHLHRKKTLPLCWKLPLRPTSFSSEVEMPLDDVTPPAPKDVNPFCSHQHRLPCVFPAFWPYDPTVVDGIWTCRKGADPFRF